VRFSITMKKQKTTNKTRTLKKKNASSLNPKSILRYPRLDTILMVERTIQKYDGEFKKKALWEHLPKKVMYQTYCTIVDYLEYSLKISIDAEGKIGWFPNSKRTKYWLSRTDLAVDFSRTGKMIRK